TNILDPVLFLACVGINGAIAVGYLITTRWNSHRQGTAKPTAPSVAVDEDNWVVVEPDGTTTVVQLKSVPESHVMDAKKENQAVPNESVRREVGVTVLKRESPRHHEGMESL